MPEGLVWLLASLLVLVGLIGAWLPVLPGLPLIAAGALLHKLFLPNVLSWWVVILCLLMALVGLGLDFLSALVAGKLAGASRKGAAGAMVGGVVGLFFNLPGLLLGPFLGAFLAEWAWARRAFKEALKSGLGAGLGFLAGTVGEGLLAIALVLVLLFDAFVL
ncbi:MAG: DUF456 domain-containing protein [Firmicutes bacterium]|nr:DUF456 domain-containing protein [Bacillota bacterium]